MKHVIWGLGAVGTSFLRLLKENNLFDPSSFYCVDLALSAKERFVSLGGIEDHFICEAINKSNIGAHLSKLECGDFLIDFTINVKNLDVLKYCLENDIHYLSTADSSWNPDPSWTSIHQHYLEYLKIKREFPNKQNTCLVEFGMNPGMVSCFAKKCLREIVEKDNDLYIKLNREKLLNLLSKGAYGKVAKKLGVTDIQEVDNDDQETSIPYIEGAVYSTWNVYGFYYETVSVPELALGNKRSFFKYKTVFDCDQSDLWLSLPKSSYEYKTKVFSPQGITEGHISSHEEIFMIRNAFSYKKYKPNVHFVYSPCDYAIRSVKSKRPGNECLIDNSSITKGGESVGIIIQGKRFKTRYFGNYLESKGLNESATILQVSASALAGYLYIQNHKNDGLLFPEDVNEEEILHAAKPYLKEYLSILCGKRKMTLGRDN